jgi:hypothetical protein
MKEGTRTWGEEEEEEEVELNCRQSVYIRNGNFAALGEIFH